MRRLPLIVAGDRAALKQALAEIMINALQANPNEARVNVRMQPAAENNGMPTALADRDPGQRQRILFGGGGEGRRTVLHHAQRGPGAWPHRQSQIVETHQGQLSIAGPQDGGAGVVRVLLPLDASSVPKV